MFVEACEGLADELLAGRIAALPGDHQLVKKYYPKIEATARAIQRHFRAPQDIEFAVENESLSFCSPDRSPESVSRRISANGPTLTSVTAECPVASALPLLVALRLHLEKYVKRIPE